MSVGFELYYNDKMVVASTRVEGQWLLFGLSAKETPDNVDFSMQRLNIIEKNAEILYFSRMDLQDKVFVKVKEINTVLEKPCESDCFVNFLRMQRYKYLHQIVNNTLKVCPSIGLLLSINNEIIKVFLPKNRNINCVINQNEKGIKFGLGASDKISDKILKYKTWLDSNLSSGDEIRIEITAIDIETPCISENYIELKKPDNQEMIIKELDSLQVELTKEGLL